MCSQASFPRTVGVPLGPMSTSETAKHDITRRHDHEYEYGSKLSTIHKYQNLGKPKKMAEFRHVRLPKGKQFLTLRPRHTLCPWEALLDPRGSGAPGPHSLW